MNTNLPNIAARLPSGDCVPNSPPTVILPTPLVRRAQPKPTKVFDSYWKFAAERQEIFFARLEGKAQPWTSDHVLREYKFTNAYRASDRVSQYLIKNVIYSGSFTDEDLLFRVVLFKLFNKIETWEEIERRCGPIAWSNYSFLGYDEALASAMSRGERIYSAAYIMAATKEVGAKKHQMHLRLLEKMISDQVAAKLRASTSMQQAFSLLRSCPMIGDFLAYQYLVDLNYSPLLSFSEMDFVMPGPGAVDGIAKCFSDLSGWTTADIIRAATETQAEQFERRGIDFRSLWGRPLQLIDCQNLFCEIDKYSRVMHPEFSGHSGRTKIKQRFSPNVSPVRPWYPPKWGINDRIHTP